MKRLVSRNSSDSTFPSSFTTKSCSIVMHTLSTNLLVATFQYAWVGLDVGVVCTAGSTKSRPAVVRLLMVRTSNER